MTDAPAEGGGTRMTKRSGMAHRDTDDSRGGKPAARPASGGGVGTCARTWSAIGAVLVALALLGGGGLVLGQRQAALDAARIAAENLALAIAEQTARSVQAVDAVLLDLQDACRRGRRRLGRGGAHDAWRGRASRRGCTTAPSHLPQIEALLVADAEGHVLNAAGRLPARRQAEAAAEAARHFAATRVPTAGDGDALFIGAPSPEPASTAGRKPWMAMLARACWPCRTEPRQGVHGRGAAAGHVRLALRRAAPARQRAWSRCCAATARVLLRQPPLAAARARGAVVPAAASPWNDVVARGGGSYRSAGIFDGSERIDGGAAVARLPIWSRRSGWTKPPPWPAGGATPSIGGVGALAACVCILLLLRALLRQFRRLEQSQASLEAANADLSRKSRELETTLGHMDQGLMMVTPTARWRSATTARSRCSACRPS